MKSTITIKIGDIIINNYFNDYRFCIIEEEREDTPLRRKDNFETPESKAPFRMVWAVRLKGYDQLSTITIFKDINREKAIEFQNMFFGKLAQFHAVDIESGKIYFLDIYKKEKE
jgi:hypothetical protein